MSLPPLPPVLFVINYMDDSYTAEQMQAYGKACREAALEEAAQVCSHKAAAKQLYLNESHYLECADAIRSLK